MDLSYEELKRSNDEFFGLETYDSFEKHVSQEYIEFFNNKFKNLLNTYNVKFDEISSVCNFLKENDDMFELLESLIPILKNYFNENYYYITITKNSEYDSKLVVLIKNGSKKNPEDVVKNLTIVNSQIRSLKKKLGFVGVFLINVE